MSASQPKYKDWRDFALQTAQSEIPQDNEDQQTRENKFHSLMLKFRYIGHGTPWIGPDQSTVKDFPWLEDLHMSYLADVMALEDYNEYQYENADYSQCDECGECEDTEEY